MTRKLSDNESNFALLQLLGRDTPQLETLAAEGFGKLERKMKTKDMFFFCFYSNLVFFLFVSSVFFCFCSIVFFAIVFACFKCISTNIYIYICLFYFF